MFQIWLRAQRPIWLIIPLMVLAVGLEVHVARQKNRSQLARQQFDAHGSSSELLKAARE